MIRKFLLIYFSLAQAIAFSQDADSDNVIDSNDNCPSLANPNQEDSDLINPTIISVVSISSSGEYSTAYQDDNVAQNNGRWLLPDYQIPGWIQFDLGETRLVSKLEVINTTNNGLNDRGTGNYTIYGSLTDNDLNEKSTSIFLADGTLNHNNTELQTIPTIPRQVRYVRFWVDSNWGTYGGGLRQVKIYESTSDGYGDACDNCPDVFNADQADFDNDGDGDACDTDDDNDGTLDTDDAFPLDPNEDTDTDGDGIGNNADTDDDGDGTLDTDDAFPLDSSEDTDTDDDGIGNNADTDDDDDGISDVDEDSAGTDSLDTDTDDDGTLDSDDTFPLDPNEDTDSDEDGTGNNADTDDDNDGFSDVDEISAGSNPLSPFSVPDDFNDSDGDGIGNNQDNCQSESNADQADSDAFEINIAEGKTTTATSTYSGSYPSSKITDGNTADGSGYWLAKNGLTDQWVEVDLGDEYQISKIKWFDTSNFGFNDRGVYTYRIVGSSSNDKWSQPQQVITLSQGTNDRDAVDGGRGGSVELLGGTVNVTTTKKIRYIRFYLDDIYSGDLGVGLNELQVFELKSDGGDVCDNCPDTYNLDQSDVDGDGYGDVCDAFVNDNTEWLDTDGDGIGNNADTDDDNDGLLDVFEEAQGTDPLDATSYTQESITMSETFTDFQACFGFVSAEQSFTVEAFAITGDLVLQAPVNFEISLTSGTSFTRSITLSPEINQVNSTSIYIRSISTPVTGQYTSDLTASSSKAPTNEAFLESITMASDIQLAGKTLTLGYNQASNYTDTPNVGVIQGIQWVEWSSINGSTGSGTLPSGQTINGVETEGTSVSLSHSVGGMSETSTYNHSIYPDDFNVPENNGIRNEKAGIFTIDFGTAVTNPQIALGSIGSSFITVPIKTNIPYQVLWAGQDVTYSPPNDLEGNEGFTIISFPGSYTSIQFEYLQDEVWVNVLVGAESLESPDVNICEAEEVTLNASGAEGANFYWTANVSGPNSGLPDNPTGANLTVNPFVTTTYTVTDLNDFCGASKSITVIVPNENPVAIAKESFTVILDDNGEGTLTVDQIENGSSDNCKIESKTIDITEFNCDNIGENTVTLTVTDVLGNTSTDQTIVTVTTNNEAPTVSDVSISTDEDTAVEITLVGSDSNICDTLTYAAIQPSNGTVSIDGAVATYTPNANFNGTDTFTYVANDSTVDSESATVTITIAPVNDAPTADDQSVNAVEQTEKIITISGTDIEDDSLLYLVSSLPSNGTLSEGETVITSDDLPKTLSGTDLKYISTSDTATSDSFTFKTNDGELDSDSATVTITIAAVNDAPTVPDVSESTDEDTAVAITLTGADVDGDDLTYAAIQPSNGTVSIDGAVATYTPNANFNGTDTFTYVANDSTVDSESATVTITIAPVNDAPTVTDISDSTDEDTAVAITLTGTDVDGDALTFETSLASNGTVSIDGAVATYTPNDNFNGTDTFIYTANDGTVNSTQADVTILVIDTTLPTLTKNGSTTLQAPIVHSIIENTIFVYDFDASEPVTFALSGTDMSLFVIDNIGNLSFITAPDYETDPTTFSVDVVITDATGNETTQTITVNVTDTQLEDSDGDGVIDADDYCLNTPIGSTVDVNGCALEIEFVSSTSAVSESGTSAVVQLQVSGDETTQDVVIELTNSGTGEPTTDYNLISSSVTLDAGDYTTAQTEYFTVSIVSDQVVEGNETAIITISSVNQGFIGSNEVHTLTINDDDIAGATVNVTDNLTSEDGSTGSFTIVLTSEPTDDVTISLSSDNTAEGTISVSSVTFTPINWNITQTISVTGVDDNPPAGDGSVPYKIVTGNVTSNDTTYNALDGTTIADASMQNENNDPPGITIQILSNSNSTTEEGDTVEVGFALLTQPVTNNADVIIPLSLSDDSEGTLSATSVTVSYTEWDTPSANSITVTGLDDSILDGTIEYFLITGDPTSTDAGYDGLVESDVVDVSLNNLDDELSQTPNPIITTITQTSITGTALPESTITIYAANGTTVIGSGTADTSGNYSITYTSTQTADSTLNVTATGSELTESNQVSGIVVDTLAPTAPVVSSASGSIVTGTAEAGSTVKVTDSNGNVLGTVVADSNGNYSVTLSPTQSDGSALTVTATDTSGNESDSTSTTADALAPTAPVVSSASGSIVTGTAEAGSTVKVTDSNGNVLGTAVADSNGNYSVTLSPTQSDGSALTVTATDTSGNESDSTSTTADALAPTAPVVSSASGSIVTGTAEAGSTVKVTDSNGNVLGTAVADSNGNYSVTLSPTQSDGSALTVTATDTSGNESDSTSTTADALAPTAPVVSSASGSIVTGTAEAGSTVKVTDSNGNVLGTVVADSNGNYSVTLSPTQSDGSALTVTATDTSGNESDSTSTTADALAPTAPVVSSASGSIVTGTAEAGSTVKVTDSNGNVLGTVVADSNGNYSVTLSPTQSDGSALTVTATDTSGNESDSTSTTADALAPTAPVVSSASGSIVTGTAEAGSTVKVTDSNGNVLGTVVADSNGNYSVTLSPTQSDGSALTVTATDTSGNESDSTSTTVDVSDIDSDGIPNEEDVDPDGDGTNDNGTDTDGDGINDTNDSDVDNDGIPNEEDVDPDGDGINDNGTDTDGDGINDTNDSDVDNDGIPNEEDVDPDGDGTNDNGTDTDGDGINDTNDSDVDNDGIPNEEDVDPDGDGTNDNGTDTDGDGINDTNDSDVDNDGIPNEEDVDPDGDGTNDNGTDTDGDGINDTNDSDVDNDGIPNEEDVDPDGDGTNDNGTDTDGDGINDTNDSDVDNDGIPNEEDVDPDGDGTNDNDTDTDGDGINDTNDSDVDNDGIPNEEDVDPDGDGTNDNGTDTDGDGINDTNDSDVDNDEIPNKEDVDPDGDGTNDNGTDTDGDGINDTNDSDVDNDGIPNKEDVDPDGDGTNDNGTDTDGDGINDTNDSDVDNDEIPNEEDVDPDGDGTNDNGTDTDGDGINDTNDSDVDNDGIPNEEDVDPDGDGTNDNGTDTDGDGINDTNDSDVDNDGIPNEEDVDPDGDGTNDNGTDTDGDGINDTNDSDNLPPTVTGDAAITINEGTTAVETYTADETVTWSKSGTDADLFTLTDAGVLSFTAAPDYEDAKDADANNTYLVTITATDSFNNVTTTNVVVTVADVDEIAPTITGEATKTVNENTTAVQTFEADETVTWSITGTDSSLFTINESTGVLVFNAAPDYEVPGDDNEDNDYVLTVTATDVAGNESTLAVTVTVADVDEIAPTITGSATKTVNEGTTAVQTFTADETVTWSITGTDASLFTINATTGVLVFNVAPDYEVPGDDNEDNDYVLTVTATDAANNQSTLAVTVTVVDLFEDEDNDGIEDHIDQCPETPEGDIVDENGCGLTQKDSDNDGVNDAIDECPETPADQKDNVDAKGCAITVGFTVTSTTVEETEGSTIITLTITGDKTSGPITVKVNFVVPTAADDATAATSGIDYKIEDNTIIIPAGDYLEGGVVEIPVSVFNDDTYESNEKVDLILDELSTGNYAQRTHVLNISDDDTVGGTIDIIDNLTSEDGETGSFSIVLNSKPTADVTIDLSSDNTEEGSININSVTFTPANWNQPKTIVVIGVDDDPAIGDGAQEYLIVTGNVTSEDPNYDELDGSTILDVPMVNENNDPPGIRARVLSATNKTSEEGATVIVGFKLLSPPVGNADVVLPVSISDDTEASIGVESVTLSAATWNDYTAHTVTITGVDDADLDGSINYLLETGDPTSEDAEYDNLTASDVANVLLVNEDDERDTDGDGILDDVDNCPETANANQADLDSDGIGDVCDTDIDGDGTDNEEDAFPRDPEEDTDTDNDGIGNNEDTDDDGDGQSDEEEEAAGSDPNDPNDKAPDTDGDGTPDFADNDDDNDGVPDDEDNCPTVKNPSQADFDGDGIGDVCDPDDDNDGQSDEDEIEAGSDPKDPDSKSEDTDGDGVPDSEDTFPNDADESVDTDGDGVGDNEDTDDDGDGTLDDEDAFPLDEDEDTDTDGDGVGNNEDADDDGDGTLDVDDAFPLDDQEDTDTDGDGIGNNEDSDDDNDRVPDAEDAFPLDGDEDTDTDDDGIGNNADTDDDGDGVLDTEDEFPLDPEEAFDADGDGLGDNEDPDDDNDGVEDIYDACPNTVPGTPVDVNGCDLLIIPTEDFTVSTTSATCSNTSDGEIVIEALDQTHSYLVTVTGQSQTIRLDQTAGYSKTLSGLAKGTYTVCFKVVGDPFFEQCYTVYIDQPEALQVVSSYLEAKQALDLQIDGATEYYVELNGVLQTRRGSRISLALQKGMNRVKIYTDLDCQGVIEEEVFVSEKLEYAPNPVVDNLNLYVGGTDTEVSLTITDLNGVVIERRTVRVPASRIYSMSMSRYREGMYLLHAKSATLDNQIKVIKR